MFEIFYVFQNCCKDMSAIFCDITIEYLDAKQKPTRDKLKRVMCV